MTAIDTAERKYVGLDTAAHMVDLSRREIERAIQANELPVRYRGRKALVKVTDLDLWMESLPTRRSA